MVKLIKSWLYTLKVKWYFNVIKHEVWQAVLDSEMIPPGYIWRRLDELLRGKNAETTKKD